MDHIIWREICSDAIYAVLLQNLFGRDLCPFHMKKYLAKTLVRRENMSDRRYGLQRLPTGTQRAHFIKPSLGTSSWAPLGTNCLPLISANCAEVDRPQTMCWVIAKLHRTVVASPGDTIVWSTSLWILLMKSTQCTVTCQGTQHQEVVLFHLSSVWLHKSRTLWSLTITRKPYTFMNSPAHLRGTLT